MLQAEKEEQERLAVERAKLQAALEQLETLGFSDTAKNTRMLKENAMDYTAVAAAITKERNEYRQSMMQNVAKVAVPGVQIGIVSRKGVGHPTNEDRECHVDLRERLSPATVKRLGGSEAFWLWGVFDGHGGPAVSEMTHVKLVDNLVAALEKEGSNVPDALVEAYRVTEEAIVELEENSDEDSGTCAVTVVMCGLEIHTAHAGDCRAILASGITGSGDMATKLTASELTHDHRGMYPGEKERIAEAGGKMIDGRVNGGLIPSRTLGDLSHKVKCPGAVVAVPDLGKHELARADQYLVLASDGLWDDMSNDRAVQLVRKSTKAQGAADCLAREVAKKNNGKHMDDFTTIVVRLMHRH